jgi:hypothetical protein
MIAKSFELAPTDQEDADDLVGVLVIDLLAQEDDALAVQAVVDVHPVRRPRPRHAIRHLRSNEHMQAQPLVCVRRIKTSIELGSPHLGHPDRHHHQRARPAPPTAPHTININPLNPRIAPKPRDQAFTDLPWARAATAAGGARPADRLPTIHRVPALPEAGACMKATEPAAPSASRSTRSTMAWGLHQRVGGHHQTRGRLLQHGARTLICTQQGRRWSLWALELR